MKTHYQRDNNEDTQEDKKVLPPIPYLWQKLHRYGCCGSVVFVHAVPCSKTHLQGLEEMLCSIIHACCCAASVQHSGCVLFSQTHLSEAPEVTPVRTDEM